MLAWRCLWGPCIVFCKKSAQNTGYPTVQKSAYRSAREEDSAIAIKNCLKHSIILTSAIQKQYSLFLHCLSFCMHSEEGDSTSLPLMFVKGVVHIDFISLSHINAWSEKYDDCSFLTYGVMSVRESPIKQKKWLAAPMLKYIFFKETMKLLSWAFDWRQIREENGCILISANRVPKEILSAY